jgi:hypothetical protein
VSVSSWLKPYLLPNGSGLNTSALIQSYANGLLGSTSLQGLSNAELQIVDSTIHAVIWGYPAQETYRLRKLNTELQAPIDRLFKPNYSANWLNKNSSPAPDTSILYVTGWLDLSGANNEKILWIPSNPDNNYFVWAILDSYINTVASIGTRTQSANAINNGSFYLIAGPSSPYYTNQEWEATVGPPGNQTTMPIIKVDTDFAWMTARFGTDTLSSSAMEATRTFINGSRNEAGSGFQLGALNDFNISGTVPYKEPITSSQSGTKKDAVIRELYGRVPELSRVFFEQLGQSILDNPIPAQRTPATQVNRPIPKTTIWLGDQNSVLQTPGSKDFIQESEYQPPAALSDAIRTDLNDRFGHIGLNLATGYSTPVDWSEREHFLFQEAYSFTQRLLQKATEDATSGGSGTNYWDIVNFDIGVYPNKWENWIIRTGAAIEGGAANIPNDAVYPTTHKDHEGNPLTSRYNYTITLPALTDRQGRTVYGPVAKDTGFWSYTVYQPNSGSAYQPFLIENSVNNRFYSPINSSATLTSDGWLKTTKPKDWNNATAIGTALYTSQNITIQGFKPSTTYYISAAKEHADDTTIFIKVSEQYKPDLNWIGHKGTRGVPVGGNGSPGGSVDLSGAGNSQSFGWINPVTELGSAQIDSFRKNEKNEIVLDLRSHQPKEGGSNWIPTPNSGYVDAAYSFEVMGRYYWPDWVSHPSWTSERSVLAQAGRDPSSALYIPPPVERTSLHRIALWEYLDRAGEDVVLQQTGSSNIDPFSETDPYDANVVGAMFDLAWENKSLTGTQWRLSYSYKREAGYLNSVYFYTVDSITGSINGLQSGDAGYLEAAMDRRINPYDPIVNYNNRSTISGELTLKGGMIYMPLIVTQVGQIIVPNSRSTLGYSHFSVVGDRGFAFEDLTHGGDYDHNDGFIFVNELSPIF